MLNFIEKLRNDLKALKRASALSKEDERIKRSSIRFLERSYKEALKSDTPFETIKSGYNSEIAGVKKRSEEIRGEMENLFDFAARAYKDGNEMLILTTEMTVNSYTSRFISRYGCDAYFKYKDEMMLEARNESLKDEIAGLLEL